MHNNKDDPLWIKLWVLTLWFVPSITFLSMSIPTTLSYYSLLETMHSAFAIRLFYYLLIISFGRMDMVAKIDWYAGSSHLRAYSQF